MPEVAICGAECPSNPEIICEKQKDCTVVHISFSTGEAWPGEPEPTPQRRRTIRQTLIEMGSRITREESAGDPILEITGRDGRSEYENQIQEAEWVVYATQVFYDFLLDRTEPFTTPEDLWPLLEPPKEMREMVQVVRRALREGWIKEIAAKRLNGTYVTKGEAVAFKMNKLVPIYRSTLARVRPAEAGTAQDFG